MEERFELPHETPEDAAPTIEDVEAGKRILEELKEGKKWGFSESKKLNPEEKTEHTQGKEN